MEAIIVTFINGIDRRTKIVHLCIKIKNRNKSLGLPSANLEPVVVEWYRGQGALSHMPASKELASTLTGYTITSTHLNPYRWQLVLPLLNRELS